MSSIRVRQSDVAAYSRCPEEYHLTTALKAAGGHERVLSATVFGSVMHHAVHVMERLHHEGAADACERAVATFEHYWDPEHIAELPGCLPVEEWLPRQTYGGLRIRGRDNLRAYYEHLKNDDGQLLGLEVGFEGPLDLTEQGMGLHTMAGQLDRISIRVTNRKPYLCVEDQKTGRKPTYLRYAFQWTYYAYASLQPWFWEQWTPQMLAPVTDVLDKKGLALWRDGTGRPVLPRKGRWISLRESFGIHDCGWRNDQDFGRMKVAVARFIQASDADIFPLNISGQTCTYCPFGRTGECAGIPLAELKDGDPYR